MARLMSISAVVLAGGRGTRSANPDRAKITQVIGDKSLLEWHIEFLERSEIRNIIVVAGFLGEQVESLCEEIDQRALQIQLIQEPEQRGTMAALELAAQSSDSTEFVVILGDILVSFPVQQFIDEWRTSGNEVGVVVHPSLHPGDSDAVFPTHDGKVFVFPKSEPRDLIPNMSSAGIFAMKREGIERYAACRDIGSDVLPAAAEDQQLFAFISSHYFKDTGTPDRLASAKNDVESGNFFRRGDCQVRAALFLDRDGVINPVEPEMYQPADYSLLPGVSQAIRQANNSGIPVIVITNQPGIAKGFMTFEQHQRVRARMDQLLINDGAFVDDYFFCPHHPDSGFPGDVPHLKGPCECRKPATELGEMAGRRHHLDLKSSVMVGDSERDRGFAHTLSMHFVHVGDSDHDDSGSTCVIDPASGIHNGIKRLTC